MLMVKSLVSFLTLAMHFDKMERNSILDTCNADPDLCSKLDEWNFSASILSSLPLDYIAEDSPRIVVGSVFSVSLPTPLREPMYIAAHSKSVLNHILDLDEKIVSQSNFIEWASGKYIIPGSVPISHRYGGHQFGMWADQLGDGRAHILGEYINKQGERWEIALKGSGITPYSRHGDGRAVLRSSVREFLASEAMEYLGVPTSRAATLVKGSDAIMRDQFYNGRVKSEPSAVVMRLAQSWFRFGSLEILSRNKEYDVMCKVLDFIIKVHFQNIEPNNSSRYVKLLQNICDESARLVAMWQSVGFVHGVLNTDNMSVLSITIDYGPFGFMDDFDFDFVPNSSDDERRYSYNNQPDVVHWNLKKLAEAVSPVLTESQISELNDHIATFPATYKEEYLKIFRRKFGCKDSKPSDEQLIGKFLGMMHETRSDFTMSFRDLTDVDLECLTQGSINPEKWALRNLQKSRNFENWVHEYKKRLEAEGTDDLSRRQRMVLKNPRYVLRNWMAQQAIERAENNDFEGIREILQALQDPFHEVDTHELTGFTNPVPSWAKNIKVSCSS